MDNMKKFLFLLMVVFLVSGCSFSMEVATEVPSDVNSIPTISMAVTPASTQAGECYTSPEAQAGVLLTSDFRIDVFGEKRIVMDDLHGNTTEVYVGSAIPYVHPFPDNRHILFVDRDCSGQQPGAPIGMRDDLWIADVPSGELHLLYQSNTTFAGYAGPQVSPDGHFIASLEGSGFGDACMIDSRLIFLELASDLKSVKPVTQEQFTGFPASNDGFVYPVEDGEWKSNDLYLVTLDGTCAVDKSTMGSYLFNVSNLTTARSSSDAAPLIAGDLGWGRIEGRIVDAVTGAPVSGAHVTCAHSSYTSPAPCGGTATTNEDGIYFFINVFFHDTDTIKLTVEAAGYQPQEFSQTEFTTSSMEANFSLTPAQ
jgi:hypothetical protein